MSPGESSEFTLNGSKCSIELQNEFLQVKTRFKDSKISSDLPTYSIKIIPFFELIAVKSVDPNDSEEKSKQGLNIATKTKLPYVEIKTVKRSKDHKWKLINIKLKSSNRELCEKWSQILQKKLSEFRNFRPKSLLIFVNPYGGTGSARNIYDKKVAPVFQEAGISTDVITTDHKHHAKDYVKENDLSDYDGLIAVGGDGMLNEVINGLLAKTQSDFRANIHTTYRNPRNSPKYHRPKLRVGVIPAGSTDCVSYVTQGINDAETSALHIVLGDSHPVDVVSLHNPEGLLQQFSLSLTGYGYFGDMLRHSENFRWMGPPRYTFVGANVFLRNKSYSGEVHYLPADVDADPRTSSFCRAPCYVCQDGLEDAKTPLFTPSTPGRSFKLSITDEEKDTDIEISKTTPGLVRNRSISEGFKDLDDEELNPNIISDLSKLQQTPVSIDVAQQVIESDDVIDPNDSAVSNSEVKFTISEDIVDNNDSSQCFEEAATRTSRPNSLLIHSQNGSSKKDELEKWKVIKGDFMSINGVAMSCACERSPLGLSPHSHLSDGAIDLIVVKSCSRLEFLRFMMAHTGKGDRFDFPFVEVHRVKAFQFIPATTSLLPTDFDETLSTPGSMTTDGESIHLSLPELRVEYKRKSTKHGNKKEKKSERKMKRSQSESHTVSNPLSTWNSDGEIIREPNMTVRVHRGLILMFCRGVENTD